MKKVLSFLMSVLILASMPVFVFAKTDVSQSLEFFKNMEKLDSWWDVAAIYAAGKDQGDFPEYSGKFSSLDDTSKVTDYAGIILALIAKGENVHNAGEGRDIAYELAQRQDADGSFGNINSQIFAMLALDAAKENYNKEAAAANIVMQERDGGGFGYMDEYPPDVDLTAMAIIALYDTGNDEVIERGFDFIQSKQLDSAGFESFGTENSNTLSTVISAVAQAGKLDEDRWKKGENTFFTALEKFKLGTGAYEWQKDDGENELATAQAIIALTDADSGKSVFKRLSSDFECPEYEEKNASVRIEGINDTIARCSVKVCGKNLSVLSAIKTALDNNNISYNIKDSKYGDYISEINGEKEGQFKGYEGWLCLVNGVAPSKSLGKTKLGYDDDIVLYYGNFEPYTLIPQYTLSDERIYIGQEFEIKLTSSYFDWNDNMQKNVNIDGAKIYIDGKEYTTDENGCVKITLDSSGSFEVKIEKQSDTYPSIVRTYFDLVITEKTPSGEIFEDSGKKDDTSGKTDDNETEIKQPEDEDKKTEDEGKQPENHEYKDKDKIAGWAKDAVKYVYDNSIMTGNENDEFLPEKELTRAEFAKAVTELFKLKPDEEYKNITLPDVSEDDWYFSYVKTVLSLQVMLGTKDGNFNPDAPITREQASLVLSRLIPLTYKQGYEFCDIEYISYDMLAAVYQVYESGIILGDGAGNFMPKKALTRQQMAVIIERICKSGLQARKM